MYSNGNSFSSAEQCEDPRPPLGILQCHVAGGIKMAFPVQR
jgi:hypothetical protein